MIDQNGYRLNVGIVLASPDGRVFYGKRIRQDAWQFPQGGLNEDEDITDGVYRELWEEVGLQHDKVEILGHTRQWLRYRIPKKLIRSTSKPVCIGQKQKWYLLKLTGRDQDIHLAAAEKPEFDDWQWVNYWYPLSQVIHFKREVYRRALKELAPIFFQHVVKGGGARSLDPIK